MTRTEHRIDTDGGELIADTDSYQPVGSAWGEEMFPQEMFDNAKTWAVAHNAANKIDAMGFDGDRAIEVLPTHIRNMCDRLQHSKDTLLADAIYNFLGEITSDPTIANKGPAQDKDDG